MTDLMTFTTAPRRLTARLSYQGHTSAQVFDLIGDPDRIPDWYVLAESIRHYPPTPEGEARFNVVFTFFGEVEETILHWAPPHRYVYRAIGPDFPIQDYVAELSVIPDGETSGTLGWDIYFDTVDTAQSARVLSIILPELNKSSLSKLASMLGGQLLSHDSNFHDIKAQ